MVVVELFRLIADKRTRSSCASLISSTRYYKTCRGPEAFHRTWNAASYAITMLLVQIVGQGRCSPAARQTDLHPRTTATVAPTVPVCTRTRGDSPPGS